MWGKPILSLNRPTLDIILTCRAGSLAYPSWIPSSFHPDDGTPQPAANLLNEDHVSLPRESSPAPRCSALGTARESNDGRRGCWVDGNVWELS